MLGALSLVAAVLTWPTWAYVPRPGIDPSWQTALSWAAALGLRWGRDVVFTYGPLGYTLSPMMMPAEQVLIAGLVHVAGAAVTLVSFHALLSERRDLSSPLVLVLSLLVTVVVLVVGVGITGGVPGGRMSVAVVAGVPLALCVLLLRSRWPIVVGAVLVATVGHQKLSEAVLVAGLIAICALGRATRRDATLFAALSASGWVALWILAGQDPADLPAYVEGQVALVSGYVSAMAIEKAGFQWTYVPAIALVALLLIQAHEATRGRPTRQRLVALAAVAWYLWVCFRQGFVRHDVHDVFFFTATAVMAIALMTLGRRVMVMGLGAAACALPVIVLTAYGVSFPGLLDRRDSVVAAGRAWTTITDAEARTALWRAARRELQDEYEVSAPLIGAMGSRPAIVDPWDLSALAATDAVLDPLPTLQTYAAYTPGLDELNARSLEERPRHVLRARRWEGSDGRFPYWESPRYQAVLYCRYDPAMETSRWLLLRPAARDRCGEPHDPKVVSALPGVPVEVPSRPGSITLASISYERSILEIMAGLVYKGPERYVTYGTGTWRMSYVPIARTLMLNAPEAHVAFAGLPAEPWPTLTLDAPGTVEFAFVDVTP